MKIISVGNYNGNQHAIKVKTDNTFLKRPIDSEQAKKERPPIFINERRHYVIGREETKFIFLDLIRVPVYGFDDELSEFFYLVEVLVGDTVYTVQLTQEEFIRERWMKEMKIGDILAISKTNYEKLLSEISPRDTQMRFFETIGIHCVDGHFYYVASDCAVSKTGKCPEFKALQEGFDLGDKVYENKKELAKKFMEYNLYNVRVFYPFHCVAVMSILRYFLKEQGRRGGAVLWIDGEVASGKTELAITLGNFFNRGKSRDRAMYHVYTPKIKKNELKSELVKYQGSIFILDDIKREESAGDKENAKKVSDLLVRSVYDGKIDDKRLDATAIVTGEYFKEQKSTISRVLYLNISSFLRDEKNSKDLRKLQGDPDYLTGFMYVFIRWLLDKMENVEYRLSFSEKIDVFFTEPINGMYWSGKELSSRMNETHANFALCSDILREFLTETLGNVAERKINDFIDNCKTAISDLIEETWLRSLDYQPILDRAFERVLSRAKIKDCRYGDDYLEANYEGSYSGYNQGRRGISFNETCQLKHKLWLIGYTKEYAGILLNFDGKDVLLVSVQQVSEMIYEIVESMMKERKLPFYPSDYTENAIVTYLMNGHKILVEKRNDSGFNRVINYPVVYYEDDSYGHPDICCIDKVQMIKVNLDASYDIVGSMEYLEMEPVRNWINAKKVLRFLGNNGRNEKAMEEALKNINKFLDLK